LRKAIYDAKSGHEIIGRVEEFFEHRAGSIVASESRT